MEAFTAVGSYVPYFTKRVDLRIPEYLLKAWAVRQDDRQIDKCLEPREPAFVVPAKPYM